MKITSSNFRPYGKLISYPNKSAKGSKRNLWRIVHTEKAKVGWRVAFLILRDKTIGRMEAHPSSDETFEPVKGKSLLFVARKKDLRDIKCFELDRPIVLKKGTWHALVSLGKETEIKITENSKVACRYWPFGFRIKNLAELKRRI